MCSNAVTIVHVLFVCVSVLSHAVLAQQYSDQCTTAHDTLGQCVLLARCPTISQILNRKPISRDDAEFLRRSGCGFEGLDPKVCCPIDAPSTTTTANPTTIDSQQHSGLLPGLNECGQDIGSKIIGGELTDLGEFPWMALLEYQTRNGKGFYCGGVLINSKYILTAAHCIKGKDLPTTWRLVSVRLGEYNTSSSQDCIEVPGGMDCSDDPIDVPIEAQIAHEDYDPYDVNQYHDIGLLRLSRSVQTTKFIAPICLPQGDLLRQSFVGNTMYVAGWGKTENKSSSDVKLKLRITVSENEACENTYRSVRVKINDVQLCAGGIRGQDSCRGDSGGPLMQALQTRGDRYFYALGVVSFGPSPCGMQGWPGVYTRVTKYVPWIISKLKP